MFYELMDVESANMVGWYDTEEDALAVVRSALDRFGPDSVMSLALATSDEDGNGELVASGADLIQRARQATVIIHP